MLWLRIDKLLHLHLDLGRLRRLRSRFLSHMHLHLRWLLRLLSHWRHLRLLLRRCRLLSLRLLFFVLGEVLELGMTLLGLCLGVEMLRLSVNETRLRQLVRSGRARVRARLLLGLLWLLLGLLWLLELRLLISRHVVGGLLLSLLLATGLLWLLWHLGTLGHLILELVLMLLFTLVLFMVGGVVRSSVVLGLLTLLSGRVVRILMMTFGKVVLISLDGAMVLFTVTSVRGHIVKHELGVDVGGCHGSDESDLERLHSLVSYKKL